MNAETVWLARTPRHGRIADLRHRLATVELSRDVVRVVLGERTVEVSLLDATLELLRYRDPKRGELGTAVRFHHEAGSLVIAGGARVSAEVLSGETKDADVEMGSSDFLRFLEQTARLCPSGRGYRSPTVRGERLRTLELYHEPESIPGVPYLLLGGSIAALAMGAVVSSNTGDPMPAAVGAGVATVAVVWATASAKRPTVTAGMRLQLSGDTIQLIRDGDGAIAMLDRRTLAEAMPARVPTTGPLTLPFPSFSMRVRERSIRPDSDASAATLFGLGRRDFAALLKFVRAHDAGR